MKLEQWVLFIDMLGYGEINGQITDDLKGNTFLDFMKSNEKIFTQQDNAEIRESYQMQSFDLYTYYEIQTTFVSDSLIINYAPKEIKDSNIKEEIRMLHSANALFIILNRLQTYIYNCLKEHNILVRGGISNKYCLIRDNYAVGEGVIDAYLNESKRAIYPRIVLSESITNNSLFLHSFHLISKQIYQENTFLLEDGDGIYYLDYLKYNIKLVFTTLQGHPDSINMIENILSVHKKAIHNKIQEIDEKIHLEKNHSEVRKLEKVKTKFEWLKTYHNESVIEHFPMFEIE